MRVILNSLADNVSRAGSVASGYDPIGLQWYGCGESVLAYWYYGRSFPPRSRGWAGWVQSGITTLYLCTAICPRRPDRCCSGLGARLYGRPHHRHHSEGGGVGQDAGHLGVNV